MNDTTGGWPANFAAKPDTRMPRWSFVATTSTPSFSMKRERRYAWSRWKSPRRGTSQSANPASAARRIQRLPGRPATDTRWPRPRRPSARSQSQRSTPPQPSAPTGSSTSSDMRSFDRGRDDSLAKGCPISPGPGAAIRAGAARLLLAEVAELLALSQDLGRALRDGLLVRVAGDLGPERRLVRVADAGELLDLAGARLLVEALHVALLADGERRVDEHFDETRGVLADLVADLAVRADRRADRDAAVLGERVRDPADAADVRVAVRLPEAEALRQVRAHDVAVEDLVVEVALLELALELRGDRRLAGAREAGEPDHESGVVHGVLLRCLGQQLRLWALGSGL